MDTAEEHKAKVLKFAESLIGTAEGTSNDAMIENAGLPDGWDLFEEPMETLRAFDDITLQCSGCGWWFESHEINTDTGDAFCDDCSEDEKGADEEG